MENGTEKIIVLTLLSVPLGVVFSLALLYFTRKSRANKDDVVNLDKMSWFRQNAFILLILLLVVLLMLYLIQKK